MICEQRFRIKKNGEPCWNCYCRHPELIENYDKAMEDETQVWQVHHRLECCFTYKFLVDMGLYYDVEPEALIFLTVVEHNKMDSHCKRTGEAKKDKKFSEEHKNKLSESHKGLLKGKFINRKDQSKKVLCLETKGVFESVSEAARKTGIYKGNISHACNGKLKTAGGYHWKFVQ